MSMVPVADLSQFASVFLVKPSSLGDIVHTLPAAHLIKQAYPHLKLRWLSNPEWMPLLEGNPDITEIIPFPRGDFRGINSLPKLLLWARGLNSTKRELPEIALDFQGLLRSALVCFARGTDPIVGMSDSREGASLMYRQVVKVNAQAHAVDRYLTMVEAFGIPLPANNLIKFPLPQGTQPKITNLPENFILLHPYSRGEGKSLSPEVLQTLCDCLHSHPVVVVGRAKEAPAINGKHVLSLLNQTSLHELIWLTRHAKACISVDSGPMHIAAALKDQTLGIHTWSNPGKVGPYNPQARVWKAGRIASRSEFTEQELKSAKSMDLSDTRRMADYILGEWF